MHGTRIAVLGLAPSLLLAATCGAWLSAHRHDGNLVVLAVGASAAELERGHIPGSIYFEYRDAMQPVSPAAIRTAL